MKNIEKQLVNFVRGTGSMVTYEALCDNADRNPNEVIHILFKVINDELNSMTGIGNLDAIRELVQSVGIILANYDDINRGVVSRKLRKLDEKIDRLKIEKRNKFVDIENAYQELEKLRLELEKLELQTHEKDTKQYDFMNYLTNTVCNITYLEYTFARMPSLVNVKDRAEVPLIRNMVSKYIESVKDDREEDILYYNNLISLILSQKNFNSNEREKQNCLNLLYTAVNQLSIGKKQVKKNKRKIAWLNGLINTIKGIRENDSQIELVAEKYNIQINFDESLLRDARLMRESKIGELSDREEVDDYVITIDGEHAIEIDDALSCRKLPNGHYLLGVHIASILGYFPYESDMVQNAISRNRSIYLPKKYRIAEDDFNRTIPIFPYDFSAKTASLLPGEPKLTRSYYFEIDSDGKVVREEFKKTITRSNRKTSYHEVDKILEEGCADKDLERVVKNLQKVTDLLDKRYSGTELYEQVKGSSDDYTDLRVKRIGAEKIVYQTMLLTGNKVAEFFANSEEHYPCLYRVHEVSEDNIRKIEAMVKNLTETYGGDQYQKLYQLLEGIYPKGWYDISGSHVGLGLEHYCHCTSGLRRGADIVVEHALETCYDNCPTISEVERLKFEIESKAHEINAKQNPIDWFVKDYKRSYRRRH